jgi:hypothetical protein
MLNLLINKNYIFEDAEVTAISFKKINEITDFNEIKNDIIFLSDTEYEERKDILDTIFNKYTTPLDFETINKFKRMLNQKNNVVNFFDYRKMKENEFRIYFHNGFIVISQYDEESPFGNYIHKDEIVIEPKDNYNEKTIHKFVADNLELNLKEKKVYIRLGKKDNFISYYNCTEM